MSLLYLFPIIIFIFSVIIHEVAHGYAAYLQGDNTAKYAGRLTLNPWPHVDIFGSILLPLVLIISGSPMVIGWAKPVPFNPYNLRNQRWGEALVAAAGPLSNIVIAAVFGLFLRFGLFTSLSDPFIYIVFINLVLAVFNLVPIPPLDGSKILFSILPYSLRHVRDFLEKHGLILLIIFIFFLWDQVFPLVSIFFSLITGISF
ncbi:MAG TPA: site-2 protease family protein [Candidatus Paceibacterota bacterium]